MKCVWRDIAYVAVGNNICEHLVMFSIYWSQLIIEWILDADATTSRGVMLCAVYTGVSILQVFIRRSSIINSYIMAIKIRKILVGALYDKIGKLSAKAVASTNSGKLITLVSADIFMIERGVAFTPLMLLSPITNIVVMLYVGFMFNWANAAIILGFYILMIILQTLSAVKQKKFKMDEGMQNDLRVKLTADMISGIRTIKSYGWEHHYRDMISKARQE